MMIKVGDCFFEVIFMMMMADGLVFVFMFDVFVGKIVVLFFVLGVFMLICLVKYLLGFVENVVVIKGKGVDIIVCMFVNDVFVMGVWGVD